MITMLAYLAALGAAVFALFATGAFSLMRELAPVSARRSGHADVTGRRARRAA